MGYTLTFLQGEKKDEQYSGATPPLDKPHLWRITQVARWSLVGFRLGNAGTPCRQPRRETASHGHARLSLVSAHLHGLAARWASLDRLVSRGVPVMQKPRWIAHDVC